MRPRPPSPSLAPGTVVGGYTVERRLGAGGYGTVHLARERDGGWFALKFLALEDVGRWGEREVSILLRLQHLAHPHVVRLLSHTLWPVEAPEYLVIVMEYVRGAALDKWAREVNPSARAAAGVLLDVARALSAVHGEGVVHRDVKASNVLVRAEDGRAVLADFGVGGYPGAPGITRSPLPPGTPEYRSPEGWRFQQELAGQPGVRYEAGPADDLWALGVTLYWLLTDRYPFEAPDDASLVQAILSRTPPAPHEVNPRVPEVLGRVCMRMLEKRPEARYATASALVAELADVLARVDATWDVALCDFHVATRERPAANLHAWANAPLLPPRRGPRPKLAADGAPGAGGVDGAVLPAKVPVPAPLAAGAAKADPRAPTASGGLRVAMGLGVAVVVLVVGWGVQMRTSIPSFQQVPEEAARTVQEVAAPGGPLEADRATAPPSVAAPPVAAASPVAPLKDGASMKTSQPSTASVKKQVRQCLGVAGACLTLACTSGAQVRPPPDPEDCPQKSIQAMKELGLDLGDADYDGSFTGYTGEPRVITVRAGSASVRVGGLMVLSCQLTLGERVYGRCNWARTRDGKTHPVCFELHFRTGELGLERKDGGDENSARVFNAFNSMPVDHYR